MKFYEVQPYIVETNHGMMSFMITVSTKWWKGLPSGIRDGLDRALVDAANAANSFAEGMHKKNKKRIKAHYGLWSFRNYHSQQRGTAGIAQRDAPGLG
jgi:TRAP-type C4-dicarboxylate transport system substrate-binding protein